MPRSFKRAKQPRRRPPFREPNARILILCCGPKTEPEYFEGLKQRERHPSIVVKIKPGKSAAPAALVSEGRSRIATDDFDQVWCVADVDRFDVQRAVRDAEAHDGLELALSDPCFELWLLLHFEDWNRVELECEKLTKQLQRHVPGYDKGVDFAMFEPGLSNAVARAQRLANSGQEPTPNPSTAVWRLVETIRQR